MRYSKLHLLMAVTTTALLMAAIAVAANPTVLGNVIYIPDGTASLPSLALLSDNDGTNTGLYRIGVNTLGVSMNGGRTFKFSTTAGVYNGDTDNSEMSLRTANTYIARNNDVIGIGPTNSYMSAGSTGSIQITPGSSGMSFVQASGSNAILFNTSGARLDFGAGGNDYFASDGTSITTPGRIISTTPVTLFSAYVNTAITASGITYQKDVAPPGGYIATAIRGWIRTAGSGGSTNVSILLTDGSNNCTFAFACNTTAGPFRAVAAGNCTFAGAATMTFADSSIGNCTTGPDLGGNVVIEGYPQ